MYLTYVLGGGGFFLAGFESSADGALGVVTLLTVGGVGVASFLRHAVFARSDAARLGWDAEGGSNFQREVGFANLAFGAVATLSYFGDWGVGAQVAITLAYGLYLLQAAMLHLGELIARGERSIGALLRGGLMHLSIAVGLGYVALNAAEAASLAPF